MSDKATCPACGSHSSGVLTVFRHGEDCPVCALPARTAVEIEEARARGADAKLTERLAELAKERDAALDRARSAEYKLEQIKGALEGRV